MVRSESLCTRTRSACACASVALAAASRACALTTAAVGFAQRLRFGGAHRRHLRAVGVDGCLGRVLLGFQFGGIDFGDQVAGLHLRAFVHVELLDPAHDLRADDDLIGVHDADQHGVGGAIGGVEVVADRDAKYDEQDDSEFLLLHWRSPPVLSETGAGTGSGLRSSFFWRAMSAASSTPASRSLKSAAATKSRTAARR